ncbi:mandelate racemase/muconate lactonizing enzyme family protein [Flexithrix dorotheae]|uniref:mandelate racemase/muconate lactonizing enzyme family protein n=1 Tax=Flexithrix dorotheae TaxID=70993 RepID=UPI00146B8504|nr:mandelate racemase/muconate lactonizing enzyme family protein [Flexithrix dorotheae]
MKRRKFIRNLALTTSALTFISYLDLLANSLAGKVKITNVQCVLTKIGFRVSPLVKITTDVGLVGIGECHHDENGYGAKDIIQNVCKPILMGNDPLDLEYLIFKMSTRTSYFGGNHGIATHAITGVEFALWDLIGKITEQPVHKILGGGKHVSEVRAYASSGPKNMLDMDSCIEFAELMKGQGWTACKTNILRDQDWSKLNNRRLSNPEVDRNAKGYANMREALGSDFDIAVHCHWELDFDSALRLANGVAPIRPIWMEDPLPIAYNEQWIKLTERSPVPILTGENLYTRDDFRPFIVNQGLNLIEIDVSMAGGLLEAKKIADLAELYYIPVCTHNVAGPIATIASASFAASVREFVAHEAFIANPINRNGKGINGDPDILGYDKDMIKNGHIQLSDRPGFGISLNEKLIQEKYLIDGESWWD